MFLRFLRNPRGNVATMFGIAIIPITAVVGIAMDYSRSLYTRSAMQNAIDATALMLSRDVRLNPNISAATVTTKAQQYFNAQYKARFSVTPTVSAVYTPATGAAGSLFKIAIEATTTVPTLLSRLTGVTTINVKTNADIVWGIKLEVALALDNTGSMDWGNIDNVPGNPSRMTELKKATKELLDILYTSTKKAGDVKFAIVPFNVQVNVKNVADNAWLDWADWNSRYREWKCDRNGNNCAWENNQDDWTGCVQDRDKPNDTNDVAPTNAATKFEPVKYSACPTAMLPLTDIFINNAWVSADKTATTPTSVLGQKINAMSPNGNTNVTIGMAWAMHAVTPTLPLAQGAVSNVDITKVIILLTDGDNTQNRWDDCSSASECDDRTQAACTSAKNAGIKVFTVLLIKGDENLLKGCASNPSMYYKVSNATELVNVFNAIAQSLTSLRIAQ